MQVIMWLTYLNFVAYMQNMVIK